MQINKSLLATCALVVYFLLDFFLWKPIFNLSNQFTIQLQSWNNNYIEAIFLILTFLGYPIAFGIIIIFLFFKSSNKIEVIKIITMLCLCAYIMGVLKIIYSQPRPYFVDSLIQAKDCDFGFGNPSGHALASLTVFIILFNTITFRKYRVNTEQNTLQFINRDNQNLTQKFSKKQTQQELYEIYYPQPFLSLNQNRLLLGVFIFLIGLSRVYLGAHSLNQVFLGWTIGAYLIFIYYEFLEDLLEHLITKAIYKKFDNKIHYLKLLIGCCAIYGMTSMIALSAFLLKPTSDQENEWLTQLNAKCQVKEFEPLLKEKCLMDSGVIVLPIIIFFCLLNSIGSYLPSAFPNEIPNHQQTLRLLVVLLTLGLPAGLIILLVEFTLIKQYFLLVYFLKCHLLFGIVGFQLIIATPWIYEKLNIDVPGDLLRRRKGGFEGQFTKEEIEMEL